MFGDVWNRWTPLVHHEEHTHDLSYSNAAAFARELPDFTETSHFAMRWRGMISIPVAGDYTFQTTSADGSMLYIDQQLVVNNDGKHQS